MAEASATTTEIATLTRSDLDLDHARVWIHGTKRRVPRWGELTPWAADQLERRLRTLRAHRSDDPPIVFRRMEASASARLNSVTTAITHAMAVAGFAHLPGIAPGSVAAWRGARAYAVGSSIDDVARLLGVRTLDSAARIICLEWRPGEGP